MTNHKIQSVDNNPNFVAEEEVLLKEYFEDGLVNEYLHKNDNSDKKFSFIDGPITANNPMGVHHGWGRTYKDLWQKYKNLRGYKQRFQNGFDCQGLWVEVEVEKELGFHNKQQIEEYGVDKFVQLCKDRVTKFSDVQTQQSKRLGYFMDWDNSYYTMSDENNYMIWHFLQVCHNEGWIYKGHESVPWCPRCQTAISQHEMLTEDYKEVVHKAIYLELPIKGREGEFLIVWTTTPWTIPANIAVAVEKKLEYSCVVGESGDKFWVATGAVERIFADSKHEVVKTVLGAELVGLHYSAPFDDLPAVKEVAESNPETFHSVVATDKLIMPISADEGTGLVHTAVSAGTEDFKLGRLRGLPMVPVIDDEASYLEGLGWLSGQNAKKHPELILDHLQERDQKGESWVFDIHNYKHRYPGCWRCKAELVWKVADEWYISMDKKGKDGRTYRERMLSVVDKITWIPDFGLKREIDWLTNMHDWMISKPNRYWGLALPIYECECGHFQVVGSKEELHEKAVDGWKDFDGHSPHKPHIDQVVIACEKCGKNVNRVGDVGNVWLDAGIVPFSTLIDPDTNKPSYTADKKYWSEWFPADFITESFPGQFKNWFYAMLAMSTALEDTNSYQTVLGFASMLAEDGRPMHKSWGNSIEFNEGAEKIGVDIMRWLYLRQNPVNNLLFGYKAADQVRRQFHLILWNSYRYLVNSAEDANWSPDPEFKPSSNPLDRFLVSRLHSTIRVVEDSLDQYDPYRATLALESFVSDLSTWYIRRSRLRSNSPELLHTLHQVLVDLSIILSPFMPFMPDRMFRNLTGGKSVHLADWPVCRGEVISPELEEAMTQSRKVVELGHSARRKEGIRVRQPLAMISVTGAELPEELSPIILDELNVKSIEYSKGDELTATLDTVLTPELEQEGIARDLMRDIQKARKTASLNPTDIITVELPSWPSEWEEEIRDRVNAVELQVGEELKVTHVKKA